MSWELAVAAAFSCQVLLDWFPSPAADQDGWMATIPFRFVRILYQINTRVRQIRESSSSAIIRLFGVSTWKKFSYPPIHKYVYPNSAMEEPSSTRIVWKDMTAPMAHLLNLDTNTVYDGIQPLTEGGTSFRAFRNAYQEQPDGGKFPGRETVILKHVAPASVLLPGGPDWSLHRKRLVQWWNNMLLCLPVWQSLTDSSQAIEGETLGLFKALKPLRPVSERSQVKVPSILHHQQSTNIRDSPYSILVLEDIGKLPTLAQVLHPENANLDHVGDPLIKRGCLDIGKRLGCFFGRLHSAKSLREVNQNINVVTRIKTGYFFDAMSDTDMAARLPYRVKGKIASDLYFPVFSNYEWLMEEDSREPFEGELCFGQGVCTPDSILLGPLDSLLVRYNAGMTPSVTVVGWQFATNASRGSNGEAPDFLAQLHCHIMFMQRALAQEDKGAGGEKRMEVLNKMILATQCIMDGFAEDYSKTLEFDDDDLSPGSLRFKLLRSALIRYGRRIIAHVTSQNWHPLIENAQTVEEMVQMGEWYLQRAGPSVEAMIQSANWGMLELEAWPGFIMKMFRFC
jgi:hypothetical protein